MQKEVDLLSIMTVLNSSLIKSPQMRSYHRKMSKNKIKKSISILAFMKMVQKKILPGEQAFLYRYNLAQSLRKKAKVQQGLKESLKTRSIR